MFQSICSLTYSVVPIASNLTFTYPRSQDDDPVRDCLTHEIKVYTYNSNNNNDNNNSNNNNNDNNKCNYIFP